MSATAAAETATPAEEKPTISPIFDAASKGELDAVDSALATDATCISAVNLAGRSALSLAAAHGHLKCVRRLLDVDAIDSSVADWTAAHHAAFGGHSEVLSVLAAKLGTSALATATTGGMTPLLLAAMKGHVACLRVLLDVAPESVKVVDVHGRTALMCAASGGSAETIELLVERGAALNVVSVDGKSALMWAVTSSKPATVTALARLGADPKVAAPYSEVIVPGQDREKGETAEDLANGRHSKDPTLRHIAKFFTTWREAGYPTGDATPVMPPIPWVQHAITMKAKEEAEAAVAADAAAFAADEPMIEELAPTDDKNDIFGEDDAAPVPVGGSGAAVGKVAAAEELNQAAENAQKAFTTGTDDLDDLD